MPRPNRSKKKPPIEISDEDSTSIFSPPSPSPGPFRTGEKRGHPQSSSEKENQKPAKKAIKPTTTMDSTDNIPSYFFSLEQYLNFALKSLTQAYTGLKEEEEEREEIKKQVEQLVYYTWSILLGENPFTQEEEEKEKANDVLKGLVEEVRALCKEVALTKGTYAERLKKDLPSLSSLPSSLLPPPFSAPSPSSRSFIFTKSKKKQLQKRKLVLITDKKDQPLDTFFIWNKVNQLFVSKLQVKKPVLASIARTKGKQNILFITTEEYNADFLVKYKDIWCNCFTF